MKKIVCLSLLAVVLFGCSKEEKLPVMVCKMNSNTPGVGEITMENDLTYDDEKVTKQVQVSTIVAENEALYDQIMLQVDKAKNVYDGMEGTTYEVKEYKDELKLVETITLVYEDMNKEDLAKVAGVQTFDGEATSEFTYISVDQTKIRLESQGFTCTKED